MLMTWVHHFIISYYCNYIYMFIPLTDSLAKTSSLPATLAASPLVSTSSSSTVSSTLSELLTSSTLTSSVLPCSSLLRFTASSSSCFFSSCCFSPSICFFFSSFFPLRFFFSWKIKIIYGNQCAIHLTLNLSSVYFHSLSYRIFLYLKLGITKQKLSQLFLISTIFLHFQGNSNINIIYKILNVTS